MRRKLPMIACVAIMALIATLLSISAPASAGGCPNQATQFQDGCAGAQTAGSVQHANWFTGYVPVNGNAPTVFEHYTRPPWNVAGVDYAVGYTGTLRDPITTLPACASLSGTEGNYEIDVTAAPCTFDHLDFSLHGGICIQILGSISNGSAVTFTNDKFVMGTASQPCFALGSLTVQPPAKIALVVKYSEFDYPTAVLYPNPGSNAPYTNSYIYATMTGGSITVEYSAMLMCPGSCIELLVDTGTPVAVTSKYNYVEGNGGMGTASLVHANYSALIPGVGTTISLWTDQFNTLYLSPSSCCGSGLISPTPQVSPGGTVNSYIADHDVVAVRPYGTYGPAAFVVYALSLPNALINSVTFTNNYIDYTGTGLYLSNPVPGSALFSGQPVSSTCSGNINLIGGTAITGDLADGWHCRLWDLPPASSPPVPDNFTGGKKSDSLAARNPTSCGRIRPPATSRSGR